MGLRKATSVILVVVMATMPMLVGCESIERETGIGKGAQIGGVSGAAAGGLIAGLAGASPAWIAASVILGALAGGLIGNQLDKRDKERYAASGYDAISTQGKGGQTSWTNPETGNSGTTTINDTWVKADGTPCKRFTQTITAKGKTSTTSGVACKEGDSWKVVDI